MHPVIRWNHRTFLLVETFFLVVIILLTFLVRISLMKIKELLFSLALFLLMVESIYNSLLLFFFFFFLLLLLFFSSPIRCTCFGVVGHTVIQIVIGHWHLFSSLERSSFRNIPVQIIHSRETSIGQNTSSWIPIAERAKEMPSRTKRCHRPVSLGQGRATLSINQYFECLERNHQAAMELATSPVQFAEWWRHGWAERERASLSCRFAWCLAINQFLHERKDQTSSCACVSFSYVRKTQNTSISSNTNGTASFLGLDPWSLYSFARSSGIISFKTFVHRFNWKRNVIFSKPTRIVFPHQMQSHACWLFFNSNHQGVAMVRRLHGRRSSNSMGKGRNVRSDLGPKLSVFFNRCTTPRSFRISRMIPLVQMPLINASF